MMIIAVAVERIMRVRMMITVKVMGGVVGAVV